MALGQARDLLREDAPGGGSTRRHWRRDRRPGSNVWADVPNRASTAYGTAGADTLHFLLERNPSMSMDPRRTPARQLLVDALRTAVEQFQRTGEARLLF